MRLFFPIVAVLLIFAFAAYSQDAPTATASLSVTVKAIGDEITALLYVLAGIAGTLLTAWAVFKPKWDALKKAFKAETARGDKAEVAIKATVVSVAPMLDKMPMPERKKMTNEMKKVTLGFGAPVAALVEGIVHEVRAERATANLQRLKEGTK